jgi:hypothetical protein
MTAPAQDRDSDSAAFERDFAAGIPWPADSGILAYLSVPAADVEALTKRYSLGC